MHDPASEPEPVSPMRFRIGLTAYFLGLIGLTSVLILVVAPRLEGLRDRDTVFYTCERVISGDTLSLVRMDGTEPHTYRIRGILAPPVDDPTARAHFAERVGLAPDQVFQLGQIARNALSVYILKQENLMVFDPVEQPDGSFVARIEMALNDLGKIALQHGQAIVTDEAHPYQSDYQTYQQQARDANAGIWREAP